MVAALLTQYVLYLYTKYIGQWLLHSKVVALRILLNQLSSTGMLVFMSQVLFMLVFAICTSD